MSELNDLIEEETAATSRERTSRVWRTCLECRKKKSKCDGKDVCKPCRNRNRTCVYPDSNDNASSSRQFVTTMDDRFRKMDTLCERMEKMMERFHEVVEALEDDEDENEDDDMNEDAPVAIQDHVMTRDSYGKLRYVGGISTMVMIEAMKSLSPETLILTPKTPADSQRTDQVTTSVLELPFFVRGHTWPPLPYLPDARQLIRPPRYISDLLINLYFDQLHFIIPVIYKPHFMQRYQILLNDRKSENPDVPFLSVFFAVCACASSLLPREPSGSSTFTGHQYYGPGLQYYESAVLLHFKSVGEGSIEQVQCLALLSMCTAGWNTLTLSWKWAGQALRAAQDLGLHRSPDRGTSETLKEELCRRIWWSIYGLDRLLSICLGRPMGIEDSDCDCEIPLDMDDTELDAYSLDPSNIRTRVSGPSRLGVHSIFEALLYCRHGKRSRVRYRERRTIIESLDAELCEWLQTVPDSVKFSTNNDSDSPHLTMCVILYITHAACLTNLHQPIIPNMRKSCSSAEDPSFMKCISAARSCIGVAELIQARVPPSHHLAFCTHHLALSGVLLLRSSPTASEEVASDVEACIRYLLDLEHVWAGARRSRLVLEELLKRSRASPPTWNPGDFATDEITDYMFRQENVDFDLSSFGVT